MKPVRTSESMRVRRELAQLLRRLRAIRRQYLSQGDLLERVNLALTEAENMRRFRSAFQGAQELRAD